MKTKIILYSVIVVINVLYFAIFYNNEYMRFRERKCIVLDKLPTPDGYKRSSRLYLILKEERGIVFDQMVSPATFSQHKKDDIIYFDLRNMDIEQTTKDNVIYFFGSVIMMLLTFGSWVWTIGDLYTISKKFFRKRSTP